MNIQISINKVSSSGSAETGGWVTLGLEGESPISSLVVRYEVLGWSPDRKGLKRSRNLS